MEDDAPKAQDRDEKGRLLPGNKTKAPNWEKGKSGNPSGRPKGFVDITRRIQNFYGADCNWETVKKLLDRAMDEEAELDIGLRALNMGLSNSQALLKGDDTPQDEAPPPVVQLEDGQEPEVEE